jgi:formylglycine-generating enzyme required for sulfatase activity
MLPARVVLAGAAAVVAAAGSSAPSGTTGRAERVRALRSTIVWIETGTFTMGSDGDHLVAAVDLCDADPLARNRNAVESCVGFANPADATLCQSSMDPAHCGPFDAQGHSVRCPSTLLVHESGVHDVWLAGFGIDRTEVTNAQYDRCVRAGSCSASIVTPGSPMLGAPEQPVVGVTWHDANAYCAWVHGRLPTEAEWERAARGRDGRAFPWGEIWNPRFANHGSLDPMRAQLWMPGCYADRADGYALTSPVGSFPEGASPDGVLDMAGNAWEWTADLWQDLETLPWSRSESRYPASRDPSIRPFVVAPRGATHGSAHVIRGGGYDVPAFMLRTTFRFAAGASAHSLSIGFRCAYDPN